MCMNVFFYQEESLQAYCAPELLNGNNQFHCDRCNAMCDAEKVGAAVRFLIVYIS
jgi:ubiquitin C-terminal hydrolase